MKQIKIACKVADFVPLSELCELQGDLKSLSHNQFAQLKNEILKTGFAFPIHIWRDADKTPWIVGGHQRVRVLRQLVQDGYQIDKVPVVEVEAKNLDAAKRRVLQDASQYGQIERQGLYEFMTSIDLGVDDLATSFHLPEVSLDMDMFKQEFFIDTKKVEFEEKDGAKELDENDFQEFDHQCPKCGFHWDDK